jgi:hypothetical protein
MTDEKREELVEISVVEMGPYVIAFVTRIGPQRAVPGTTPHILSIARDLMDTDEIRDAFRALTTLLGEHIRDHYEQIRDEDEAGDTPPPPSVH